MSRWLSCALALLVLGCANDAQLPPIELGSGGARLMNGQGRTPLEAYQNAHAGLGRQHYDVRRNLGSRGQNLYAARESMAALVRSLETMRALAGPADQPRFDPYIARYRGWQRDLDRNFWGGSFLNDLERSEIEVKSKLSPANVEILAEFPGAAGTPSPETAASPSPAPAPRPSEGVPPDKAVVPAAAPSAAPPKPAPAAAPAASGDDARIYYKAWNQAHDDLVAAYKAKKDCRPLYQDVVGALTRLKAHVPPAQASKLEIYLQYYAGIHDKTRAFTLLPEGEQITEKDILDELDVAARVLRGKEFNPDKN